MDTLRAEQGLPDNSATSMVQTADGYLWVGTFNGLARFDGVKFTVFDPGNTPGLPNAGIVNLHLDRSSRLWASTLQGMAVCVDGKWRAFGADDGWAGDFVSTFAERPNGDLLLTTHNGYVLEFTGGRFHALPNPPGQGGKRYCGFVDDAGQWGVVQHRFIGSWDGQKWVEKLPPTTLPAESVGACPASDAGVWIISGTELVKYHQWKEIERRHLPEAPGGLWSLFEDSQSNVWISTFENGVFCAAPNGNVRHWAGDQTHGRFVFEDREKNLWIGTSGGGLSRLKLRRFQSFGVGNGAGGPVVNSVWPDSEGGVLVATYGKGLFRIHNGILKSVALAGRQLSGSYLQSVLIDRAGRTWVGAFGEGLFLLENGVATKIPPEQTGGNNVIALFEDSKGLIWIAGGAGVSSFDGKQFKVYGAKNGLPSAGVGAFAQDNDGAIWVSNLTGVFRLVGEEFVEIRDPQGRTIPDITCMKSGAGQVMWMGSRTASLLRWQPGRLDRVDAAVGFPSRSVHGLIEDDLGFWWMTSRDGIIRANAKDLSAAADGAINRVSCQLFETDDGLVSTECPSRRQPTCARDAQGKLWFATVRGAVTVDPSKLNINNNPPPVRIEQFSYETPEPNDKPAPDAGDPSDAHHQFEAPFKGRLTVPPGSSRIAIDYTALSFVSPEDIRFEVMLEGYDRSWQRVGNSRQATYHELNPGDYVFRVRATNNDGIWNDVGTSVSFTVEPLIWQAGWFRIGAAAVLVIIGAGIAWWFAHARLLRVRAKLEIQEQRAELAHLSRVNMLGELSGALAHELNQPLTAILSNAQAAQRFMNAQSIDLQEVREILGDIVDQDKRAGEVIHRLRLLLKKGKVQHQPLDLAEVVQEVLKLMHSELIGHQVDVQTDISPQLPVIHGDRVQLQQVLLNLLMNACEAMAENAADDRRLYVRAATDDNGSVQLSVSDVGCGIPEDRMGSLFRPFYTTKDKGMGMGLSVCQSIISSHGGKLLATNNMDRGATFHCILPVHRAEKSNGNH